MENRYFSIEESLADISEKYPELIALLVNKGFAQLKDEKKRKELGRGISLKQAVELKGLNLEKLVKLMIKEIETKDDRTDITVIEKNGARDLRVEGLLPCPVRLPLLERLETATVNMSSPVSLELKAASQGLGWLKDKLSAGIEAKDLADIFISAGFDLFFDRNLMEGFRQQGVFKDSTGINELNSVFKDTGVDLLDPVGDYAVLAVVPAVFLINRAELAGRRIPHSWEDILSGEFKESVSLPVSDFDLFNAILLNIYHQYGREGVKKLAVSLLKSQHPSQMIQQGGRKQSGEAAVTIMPYFFTRMAGRFPHLEFIWPEDGAIISPIFMLIKEDSLPAVQPLVDFFASEEVAEILAGQGLFPSVLPGIDNGLDREAGFMWPGWDFLRNENPGRIIDELTKEFNNHLKGVG